MLSLVDPMSTHWCSIGGLRVLIPTKTKRERKIEREIERERIYISVMKGV